MAEIKQFVKPLIGEPTKPIASPTPAQAPVATPPVDADATLPSTPPTPPVETEEPVETPEQSEQPQQPDQSVQKDWIDFYVIEKDKSKYDSNWKKPMGHFAEDKVYVAFKKEEDARKNVQLPQVAIHIKCPVSSIQRYQDPQNDNKWAPESGKMTEDSEKLEKYNTEDIRIFELSLFPVSQNPGWMPELLEGFKFKLSEGKAMSVDEFYKLFT